MVMNGSRIRHRKMEVKSFAAFAFSEKISYRTPRWQHRTAQPVVLPNVCESSKAVFPNRFARRLRLTSRNYHGSSGPC